MNRIRLPRYMVIIGIGLIILAAAYSLLFPFFKSLAFIVLGLGILFGLAAESFRRGYSKARHTYIWDYLGNENPVVTAKKADGTTVTLKGEEVKRALLGQMQGSIQAAFSMFVLGTVYSLVGFVTSSLDGIVLWVVLVIILLLIAWNVLLLLIRPRVWKTSFRGELAYYDMLFGRPEW